VIKKIIKLTLGMLKGLSQLFPPWLTNPGLMGSVGRDVKIGLKGVDPETDYEFLILRSDSSATLENRAKSRGPRIINVQLSPSFFLETTHTFPINAAGDIKAALALHIRQNTPFSAQDIVWRYQIGSKHKGMMTAKLFIIKRHVLEMLLEALSGAGMQVKSIQLEHSGLAFLDRTHDVIPAQRFWRRFGQGAFVLSILAVLATGYANYQKRTEKLGQITHETARLQDYAIGLREKATAQQAEATKIASLMQRLNQDRQILHSLSSLTELLPDTTWLAQLAVRQKDVRLAGFSTDDPSNLVPTIENSPQFSQVLLSGPVTRDQRLGQNRFEMAMSLEFTDE